jgi:hypothetical protein
MGVLATPALATYHLEMVNEVMLASSSGDSGVRFVELLDHGGTEEAFPPVFGPFKLGVYDGAGNKLGEQTLDPAGLRSAASADREYLISTSAADAAFGVTGDEVLTVALPAAAGQVCFEGSPQPPAVSCLTWGTITKRVAINSNGSGSVHGPVPPNGQSDQRQSSGSVIAAAPTPKARNRSAGGGGGGGKAFAGVGFGSRKAPVRHGRARVALTCPKGSGRCSGRLKLTARGGKHARLGSATFSIAAGKTRKVSVKLTKAAKRKLAGHRKLKARAVATARNTAGRRKTTRATITLVRPKG